MFVKNKKGAIAFLTVILAALLLATVGAFLLAPERSKPAGVSAETATEETCEFPSNWKNNDFFTGGVTEITFAKTAPEGYSDSGKILNEKINIYTKIDDSAKYAFVYGGVITAPADSNNLFGSLKTLKKITFDNFSTRGVTNMRNMFSTCHALTAIEGINNFYTDDVGKDNGGDMAGMFFNCFALTSLDLSSFNTEQVTDMSSMFYGCTSIASFGSGEQYSVNIGRNFYISSVTSMSRMFYGCTALRSVDFSSFNAPDVSNITEMFVNCSNLTTIDLSKFNAGSFSLTDMFNQCRKLETIKISDSLAQGIKNLDGTGANVTKLFDGNMQHAVWRGEDGTIYCPNSSVYATENKCFDRAGTYNAVHYCELTVGLNTQKYYSISGAFYDANNSAAATIKLLDNVDIAAPSNSSIVSPLQVDEGKNITLDLNGKQLKYTGDKGSIVSVLGTLTLDDSAKDLPSDQKEKHTVSNPVSGGNVMIAGGVITGGKGGGDSVLGGAIFVNSKGTFNMNGGTLAGNTAAHGGAVRNEGKFNMNGGAISYNKAGCGGGICVDDGHLDISGGTVSYNESTDDGGGIFYENTKNDGSYFNFQGGEISHNKAKTYGGGVHLYTGVMYMGDAMIEYNTTEGHGGGVYVTDGSARSTESGGVLIKQSIAGIIGNTAVQSDADSKDIDGGAMVEPNVGEKDPTEYHGSLYGALKGASATVATTVTMLKDDIYSASTSWRTLDVSGGKDITLDLNGHSIKGGGSGNGLSLSGKSKLTVTNSKSTGGEISGFARGIYVSGDPTGNSVPELIMYDVKITGNSQGSLGGGVALEYTGSFTMEGGSVIGNAAGEGGGVYVGEGCTFTMKGGVIENNTTSASRGNGGGVYVAGAFTMKGGEIRGNTSESGNGGGVYVDSKYVVMENGVISGNTAKNGGGVYVSRNGAFTMNNGTIGGVDKGNTAEQGGGVYAGGTFDMCGGTISHNSVNSDSTFNNGGGVFVDDTFNISGAITITDNVKTSDDGAVANNVYTYQPITVSGALNSGSRIGVTKKPNSSFPGSSTVEVFTVVSNYKQYMDVTEHHPFEFFIPDDKANNCFYFNGNNLKLNAHVFNDKGTCRNCGETKTAEVTVGDDTQVYTSLTSAFDAASAAGTATVKLLTDVTGSNFVIGQGTNITLDLNGHKLIAESDSTDSVIYVDGNFTLTDSDPDAENTITSLTTGSEVAVRVQGGVITGSRRVGILVRGGGVFEMQKGTIAGIFDSRYGGVYVQDNATFNMSGGTISHNIGNNGGVYVGGGTFNMSAGTITHNVAEERGGGVRVVAGTFNMSGGTIKNNVAAGNGGGVWVGGEFAVSGTAKIIDNKKGDAANNVYLSSGKKITVTGLLYDGSVFAEIGVTLEDKTSAFTDSFIQAGTGSPSDFFVSDDSSYAPVRDNGECKLAAIVASVTVGHGDNAVTTKYGDIVQAFVAANSAGEATVTLLADAEAQSALVINHGITTIKLDLNGYMLTFTNKDDNGFKVNATFILTDLYGSNNKHDVPNQTTADSDDTVEIVGGVITGCTTTCVTIDGSGTFQFNDGTIAGNKLENVVYIPENARNGTFNFFGGEISYNAASDSVVKVENGEFYMWDTTAICNNVVDGGGVYVLSGTFNMKGGRISGNTGGSCAGVYVASGGTFTVSGLVTVTGNKAGTGDATVARNVIIYSGAKITVTGALKNDRGAAQIGVTVADKTSAFTVGYAFTNKDEEGNTVIDPRLYFISDVDGCIRLDQSGEVLATDHDFDNGAYKSDDTHHWKKCKYCTAENTDNKGVHSGGAATCNKQKICETCQHAYGTVDPNKHSIIHLNKLEPTCTEDGMEACDFCSDCNKYFVNGVVKTVSELTIAKKGHTPAATAVKENAVAATCSAAGSYDDVIYCTVCSGEVSRTARSTPIDPAAHKIGAMQSEVGATCEGTGVKAHKDCELCHKHFDGENAEITDLAIAALGHEWATEFTVDKQPTVTEKGSKSKHCLRCDHKTEVTEIPMLRSELVKPDEDGGDNKVVVTLPGGFAPEIELVVTEIERENYGDYAAIAQAVDGEINTVYDVTLKSDGVSVQPDGTLTIRLRIPENLKGKTFKLFHLHGGAATDTEYSVDGSYAVVTADSLSEFIFVGEKSTSGGNDLSGLWIALIVIMTVVIVGEVAYLGYYYTRKRRGTK